MIFLKVLFFLIIIFVIFFKSTYCEEFIENYTNKYKCRNDRDTLYENKCYVCNSRNSIVNPLSLTCDEMTQAYQPVKSYILQPKETECKNGYVKDENTCQQCNPQDIYKSGKGCLHITSKKPSYVYPANEDIQFNPFQKIQKPLFVSFQTNTRTVGAK